MRDVVEIPASAPEPVAPAPIDPHSFSDARKYLIFGIMAFGQFMALIDIQIVAASLNDVQAGAYYRLTPSLRVGGAVSLGDQPTTPDRSDPTPRSATASST